MGKNKKAGIKLVDAYLTGSFDHLPLPSAVAYAQLGYEVPVRNPLPFQEAGGVFFGVRREWRDCYIGKHQNEDGHILVVGGLGSGKTSGPALMSLGTWDGRIIALDIKVDEGGLVGAWYDLNKNNRSASAKHREKRLKVFNPTKEGYSRYDPYSFLRIDGEENLVENARELALAILPTPPEVTENMIWVKLAQNLLTGVILHYYGIGATFNQTMLAVQAHSVEELLDEIVGCDIEDTKSEAGNDAVTAAQMYVSKLRGLKPEILAGIGMDFGKFIALAVDPLVRAAFDTEGETDIIDWNDFNSNENVYDVILQIPEDKLEQWEPMTTLMLNQLIKMLERRADKHSSPGRGLDPILIMLDEFPRLGTCHAIKNGLATLRSRGVTFALFVQTLAQLDERYGVNGRRDILGCCSYKALFSVTEPDDQEYFSRLIGTVRVGQRSIGENLDTYGVPLGYTRSVSEVRERIFEPEKLGTLGGDLILLTPEGFCRVQKASFHEQQYRELLIPSSRRLSLLDGYSYCFE